MTDSTSHAAAPVHAGVPHLTYWKAWAALLAVTLVMILVTNPVLVTIGMTIKAAIIVLWFMHLKYERFDFILYVLLSTFLTALVLFGLILPDGYAM